MTPAIDIYELHQGEYRLTAHAAGDESLSVAAPFPVSVSPTSMVQI